MVSDSSVGRTEASAIPVEKQLDDRVRAIR